MTISQALQKLIIGSIMALMLLSFSAPASAVECSSARLCTSARADEVCDRWCTVSTGTRVGNDWVYDKWAVGCPPSYTKSTDKTLYYDNLTNYNKYGAWPTSHSQAYEWSRYGWTCEITPTRTCGASESTVMSNPYPVGTQTTVSGRYAEVSSSTYWYTYCPSSQRWQVHSCCPHGTICSGGYCIGVTRWGPQFERNWNSRDCGTWGYECHNRQQCYSWRYVYYVCRNNVYCTAPATPYYKQPNSAVCIYAGPKYEAGAIIIGPGRGRGGQCVGDGVEGSSTGVCPPSVRPMNIRPGSTDDTRSR